MAQKDQARICIKPAKPAMRPDHDAGPCVWTIYRQRSDQSTTPHLLNSGLYVWRL